MHAFFGAAVPLCARADAVSNRAQKMVKVSFFTIVNFLVIVGISTKNRAI